MPVDLIAELAEDIARCWFGTKDFEAVAVLVVLARRAVGHQEIIEAFDTAVAGRTSRETPAVGAVGRTDPPPEILAVLEKVERADRFVAHRAGSRRKARIGRRRTRLDLDALQKHRVDHVRAGMVPTRRRLRHAVDADGQIGLFHAEHVDALRRTAAARNRHRRFAREKFGDVGRLQRFQVFLRDDRAARSLDVFLAVIDDGDRIENRNGSLRGFLRLQRGGEGEKRDAGERQDADKLHVVGPVNFQCRSRSLRRFPDGWEDGVCVGGRLHPRPSRNGGMCGVIRRCGAHLDLSPARRPACLAPSAKVDVPRQQTCHPSGRGINLIKSVMYMAEPGSESRRKSLAKMAKFYAHAAARSGRR